MRIIIAGVLVGACAAEPEVSTSATALPALRVQAEPDQADEAVATVSPLPDRGPNAVAVDVVRPGWPGRAMEPVLVVGDQRFGQYEHVSMSTLRFIVLDRQQLGDATAAMVYYGDQPFVAVRMDAGGQP